MFALRILVHQLRMQLYRQLGKLMPQQRPMMFVGSGSSLHLCNLIAGHGVMRLLVVTDAELVVLGLVRPIVERLEQLGLAVTVYDSIEPNPSVDQMQRGIAAARVCAALDSRGPRSNGRGRGGRGGDGPRVCGERGLGSD